MVEPARISKEELVRQYRTEEILSAARRVIVSEGISGARLERIAEEAGVAKGTIYLYFDNKDSLIGEVLCEIQEQLLEEVRQTISEAETAQDQVSAIVSSHLEFARKQRHLIRAVFLDPGGLNLRRDDFSVEEYLDRQKRYEEILGEVIKTGIRSGEFKKVHTARSAALLYELLKGLVARVILGLGPKESQMMASDLKEIFFNGVVK